MPRQNFSNFFAASQKSLRTTALVYETTLIFPPGKIFKSRIRIILFLINVPLIAQFSFQSFTLLLEEYVNDPIGKINKSFMFFKGQSRRENGRALIKFSRSATIHILFFQGPTFISKFRKNNEKLSNMGPHSVPGPGKI